MTTASGDKLECRGKGIFTLNLNNQCVKHEIWVAEIEGKGILGYDFLTEYE